jgi:hypothetical protein
VVGTVPVAAEGIGTVPGCVDTGGVETVTLQPAVGTTAHSNTGHRWWEVLIPNQNKSLKDLLGTSKLWKLHTHL